MKKYISVLLFVMAMVILTSVGCSSEEKLTLKDGVLSWEAVKKATCYEVKLNEVSLNCDDPKVNLAEVCEYEGDYTVTVSYVQNSGKKKEIGSTKFEARYAKEPEIIITENEGQKSFAWKVEENVTGYVYDLHDGYGNRVAKPDNNQCRVEFDGGQPAMITVTAKGTSKDGIVFIDKAMRYQFDGSEIFSLAELVNYPFYYTSTGKDEEFIVGTTLERGNHDVELCYYIMDSKGMTVKGNGVWGRRFLDKAGQHVWFCANELADWPGSGNTIPIATQLVKQKVNFDFNKYGEATIPVYNFLEGEMMVVADVLKDGKSVIADKPAIHDPEDNIVFDVSKLEDYMAVFKSTGAWYSDKPEDCTFEIPVDLKDGIYRIELSYQLMTIAGKRLAGEGMWGRRICDVDMSEITWWSEYEIEPHTEGIADMPLPTETLKTELPVVVKNGKCKILCLDFEQGEIMAVSAVKKISGSSEHFDIATLKNYKHVFVGTGEDERFRVETTLCERGHFELEVTYYVMDKNGYILTGNGTWGRRMVDEKDEIWICAKAPNEDHLDAENTIPEPTEAVTKKMLVTLNNKGRFFLDVCNFSEGEILVITDVKYQGKSIIVN